MKMFIKNKSDTQPFSTDIEDSFGEMIRILIQPGEEVCVDNVDPLFINQDEIFRREVLLPSQPGGWLIVRFVCEEDDLVALNTKICIPGGVPAVCGQILVADANGTFVSFGPGANGEVLIWDDTEPLCVRFGPVGTTLEVLDEGVSIGFFTKVNIVGPGVIATDAGGGQADITHSAGGFDVDTILVNCDCLILTDCNKNVMVDCG